MSTTSTSNDRWQNNCLLAPWHALPNTIHSEDWTSYFLHQQHTHTRLTAIFPGLPGVSRYQKGKTNLDFTEARDSEWQWHQLGHMQICISLQTDNHASTPPLSFYRPDALPATQPTASKHWRHDQQNIWNMRVPPFTLTLCQHLVHQSLPVQSITWCKQSRHVKKAYKAEVNLQRFITAIVNYSTGLAFHLILLKFKILLKHRCKTVAL